ncbi:unnamed protein product [Musa acuminata subsp. malaccensis]|uniref:(wild Malaysian banana) hypothetical protein n=1 Tax=Musa acuminata subsp. malaccensis TaxID=214687 RepID=A0A804JYU9_MUSAM|nr:PREDICTED: gibberellin-regulated protein 6 [Musa acuminata subsp. malaccensis]CAG1857508.1 unnamed protein product [Musa acuminata subsp. malaccensis]
MRWEILLFSLQYSPSASPPASMLCSPMAKLVPLMMLLLLILVSLVSCEIVREEVQDDDLFLNAQKRQYGSGSLKSYQCPGECTRRCSRTQYHKPCMFFCQKCCRKCLCVPPGFYGNKQVCSCYNNWKTKRGGPKCP